MPFPKRKLIRLKHYDYSQNGAYFVTICTQNRQCLFADKNSTAFNMVDDVWNKTISNYENVQCHNYVLMPNHFHAIVVIEGDSSKHVPTISQIAQAFKRHSTIEYIKLVKHNSASLFNSQIWQRSHHDRIIRNEQEYLKVWHYIDTNPLKWELDCYYSKDDEN